jgi:hypothetical protein
MNTPSERPDPIQGSCERQTVVTVQRAALLNALLAGWQWLVSVVDVIGNLPCPTDLDPRFRACTFDRGSGIRDACRIARLPPSIEDAKREFATPTTVVFSVLAGGPPSFLSMPPPQRTGT